MYSDNGDYTSGYDTGWAACESHMHSYVDYAHKMEDVANELCIGVRYALKELDNGNESLAANILAHMLEHVEKDLNVERN